MERYLAAAKKHFATTDPVMDYLLKQALSADNPVLFPEEKAPEQYYASIASSIISQQISTAAARSIKARVDALVGTITPETILTVDFFALKSCGLSEKKTQYLKHNAEVWHEIPSRDFVHMTDEAIIKELTKLYGIGQWTAEMFLMFSLARPNVFSYGDLGLMKSLYRSYNYKPHYRQKIARTVDGWSPYKTIASLALWHQIDNGPVLL